MSGNRALKETIATEAKHSGIKVEFGQGGKHAYATLSNGTASKFVTFPLTPSDQRSQINVRAVTRRVIRSMQPRPEPRPEPEPDKFEATRKAWAAKRDAKAKVWRDAKELAS